MKKLFTLFLGAAVFMNCATQSNETEVVENEVSTEVASVSYDGFYGEEINADDVVEMDMFLAKMKENDSLAVKLKGTIEKTCKMKGCWMTVVTNEGETMRVSFKDYGFFVPQEGMEGKEVIFEGMAKKKVMSEQELKHYAQDGGATKDELEAISGDSEELTFIANGVIIKDANKVAPN